ncbi:MAG: hypothetical protein ACLTDX_14935 [[Clostridium] innocuum]
MGWQSTTKTDPERQVEKYLTDCINNNSEAWHGNSHHLELQGCRIWIVIMNGQICFVELKRPKGGRVSDMQQWRIKQLRGQGVKAYVLRNREQIDYLISHMMRGELPE